MKTDDLIKILSSAPQGKTHGFSALVGFFVVACFLTTWIVLKNIRPELVPFDAPVGFFIKTAILLCALLIGLMLLKNSAKPVVTAINHKAYLVAPLCLVVLVLLEWGGSQSSTQQITDNFLRVNFKSCLFFVTVYGVAGMAALTILMKRYAPANEKTAGALIGYTAACAGGLGYSFHCPVDSPTFIAVAYGAPILLLALAARFIVPKFIRW